MCSISTHSRQLLKGLSGSRGLLLLQQNARALHPNNTFVLERRYPVPPHKSGKQPLRRRRHVVYNLVEGKGIEVAGAGPKLSVILREYIPNVGQPGEQVELRAKDGRELVLMKKAVYSNPENLEKYGSVTDLPTFSSRYVKNTLEILSKTILVVTMSKENPWTLEPWHVRIALRKAFIIVPDYAITMPKNPIKGPDLTLQGKEFYVTVTINKTEKAVVRCRIHHWASKLEERLPWTPFPWKKEVEPMFAEDKSVQASLPPIEPLQMNEEELQDYMAKLKAKSQGKRI